MRSKQRFRVTVYLLIFMLLFPTLAFGQVIGDPNQTKATTAPETPSYAAYLIEVSATNDASETYGKEAQAIARVLSSNATKNAVLIDEHGYARELVLQSVAARLNGDGKGKTLFRVNWNALFGAAKDQDAVDRTLKGILDYVAASKGKIAIYLDDISSFSSETPMLGAKVASDLYAALLQGKIHVMSASDSDSFERQIAGDSKLRPRFERIGFAKEGDDDPFVGDKLSPDLRELVAGADQNRTVKVILQSDDIDNPQLLKVLKENNVAIEQKAEAMNMLAIELPVRAAEQVAAVRGAKHLSLDRDVENLGHIETTTGVAQVRTMTNTIIVGGLLNTD